MPETSPRKRSPVAERIRARLGEIGLTESEASEALGNTRTVLSTQLRRLDKGEDTALSDATVTKLEKLLGRSGDWIRKGYEGPGVPLRECHGWAEAAARARDLYGLTEEQIALVGGTTFEKPLRFLEASLIRMLADAL